MNSVIRAEGFNTPPFMAVKEVLNPECNSSGEQHAPSFRAGLLIVRNLNLLLYALIANNDIVN